ncbi:hypothetical protein RKD30_006596 [Streptomyces pristinaespiralis]
MNGADRRAATRMSTSPMVSFIRRRDPAYEHRTQPRMSESSATSCSATSMAALTRIRPSPAFCSTELPCRRLLSVRSPKPFRSRSRSLWIASSNWSTEATSSSSYRTMALRGPSPGIMISSRTPAGTDARASSTTDIRPVRRYSTILSATDLPTFGISRSPLASSFETSVGKPPTARAAFS